MAESLFLRLSDTLDDTVRVEWMLLDDVSGIVRFRGDSDIEAFSIILPDLVWSGKTNVMLHGDEVLLSSANVPSKQHRQILQAVPFMIEESLASDIDACHFAIGGRDENGEISVAVIDSQRLKYWLKVLLELGIKPDVLTVDILSVPRDTGCSIMLDADRVLVRQANFKGLSIESKLMACAIDLLPEEDKENLTFLVHQSERAALTLTIDQINAEQNKALKVVELEYSPFEVLCRGFNPKAINLLQGQYKPEQVSSSGRSVWRPVVILAVCAFVFQIVLLLGQGIYLNLKANEAESQSRQLYASIFTQDKNVRDLRRRWKSHLGETGGSEGEFLGLFTETIKNIPGTTLILNSVNYNQGRGSLVLQLEATRSEQVIQFSQALNKMGLFSEIGAINQGDNSVKGSIKISTQRSSL